MVFRRLVAGEWRRWLWDIKEVEFAGLGDGLNQNKKNEKSGNSGDLVEKVQGRKCFIRGDKGDDEFSFRHSFFLKILT